MLAKNNSVRSNLVLGSILALLATFMWVVYDSTSSLIVMAVGIFAFLDKSSFLQIIKKPKNYIISAVLSLLLTICGWQGYLSIGILRFAVADRVRYVVQAFVLFYIIVFFVLATFESMTKQTPIEYKKKNGFLWPQFLCSIYTFFVSLGIGWVSNPYCFPSGTSVDTFNQWAQIKGSLPLCDVHSIAHTLFMKLLLIGAKDYGRVIFIQLLAVSIMLALFCEYIMRKGKLPFACIVAPVVFFSICNMQYVMYYPWKDTFYSVGVLAVTYYVLRIINKDLKFGWLHSILFGVALAFTMLMRKNGILIILAVAIFILVQIFKNKKKMLISTLCVAIVCILATNFVAYNIFKTEKSDKNGFAYAVFGTAIARVVAENGNITDEQMQRIEKNIATKNFIMSNYSETEPYTLIWAQETNDPEGFFKDKTHEVYNNFFVVNMAQNKGEVIKLYFELLPKNFGIMAQNVLVSTLSLWGSCNYENVERDVFKITGFSFYSHIFQFLVLIAASFILLKKGRKKYFWLLAIPVFANSVSIAISAVTNELRYLQPMALLFAPIILQMVVWARQDNGILPTEQDKEKPEEQNTDNIEKDLTQKQIIAETI